MLSISKKTVKNCTKNEQPYYTQAMATLSEIAQKTNVSIATVSRIINNDDSLVVTDRVRFSVLKVAHELGYKTPRQKKRNNDRLLIAIADWHVIPEEKPVDYSTSAIASLSSFKEEIAFTRLARDEEKSVDGIIALGRFNEEEREKLLLSSQNIVFINSNKDLDYSFDRIIIDFELALNEAIDYLTSMGSCNIAYIGGIGEFKYATIGKKRTENTKKILIEKGLFSKDLFLCGNLKNDGKALMRRAIESGADGAIIASQLIEDDALMEYKASNKDFPIILYRDIDTEDTEDFPTIRMYTSELWQRAVRILIDNTNQNTNSAVNIYIPAHLEANHKAIRQNIRS